VTPLHSIPSPPVPWPTCLANTPAGRLARVWIDRRAEGWRATVAYTDGFFAEHAHHWGHIAATGPDVVLLSGRTASCSRSHIEHLIAALLHRLDADPGRIA
jgi:hypothetical protein